MSTVCVKFNGKVTRVIGTSYGFLPPDRVSVFAGAKLVASLYGHEAWLENFIPERDTVVGFTGYYVKGVTLHYASPFKYLADGVVKFTITSSGCPSTLHTHEEWVDLGFVPVARIDS